MASTEFDFPKIIKKYDRFLARGLSKGMGDRNGQMCIEAAVCAALDLPHGDDPNCVSYSVRSFKIALNDSTWSSSEARAKGLRNLGIAQIGSLGVVDNVEFSSCLVKKTIQVLIPELFRELFPENEKCLEAARRCELEGSAEAAESARDAADRAAAASAARSAAFSARAANSAVNVVRQSDDKYLIMSADLALDVLKELKSPGCDWI